MVKFKFAIRNFAGAAGVFAAAFYVAESGITTMMIIGIIAIIAGLCSFRIYNEEDGKRYGPYMLLYGGILLLASIICRAFDKNFGILYFIGAFAVALTGYFQWTKMGNLYGPTKVLRKIEGLAIFGFPILITIGVILSVFTSKIALGKGLIIGGAVIWAIHNVFALICMDSNGEPDLNKFNFDARKSTYNFDKNRILDENDVINIVHLIAGRSGRNRDSLPHGAAVTVYVFEEVSGSNINYTISGTLHGTATVLNEQKTEVQAALLRKLQQIQEGLIRTTQRELAKYKQLPYSSYTINAEIGYFDE